jgi:armadillo repeat-containing protein 8
MVREQTLNLIRNIGCGRQENIDEVFNGFGNSHFIEILESNIQRLESQQIILQTLYIIVNIATGSELHKSRIMESTILLQSILNYLVTNLIELYLKILIF